MGGKKKPTLSQLEKRMRRAQKIKEKKEKKPEMKIAASGALTSASMDQIRRELVKMPYITPYLLASKFGLKISRARSILRTLESEGLIRAYDYNRRVPIYVPIKERLKGSS